MYNQRCYAIARFGSCRSRDASISRHYDYAHEKELQWQSVAIRGHQWQSVAISGNQHEKELQSVRQSKGFLGYCARTYSSHGHP